MRLTLRTMFKLILRLLVHGTEGCGYDYDATIDQVTTEQEDKQLPVYSTVAVAVD
jgi:hypothetical protein